MRASTIAVVVFVWWLLPSAPARAALGSFAPADGYNVGSGTILGDVTLYNAGQYGPNSGGGPGPTQIPADSGLWQLLSPLGGYFPSSIARAAVVSTGPPYAPNPPGTVAAYVVGNHFPGRNNDGSNLALRNDTPFGTGPIIYDYTLDTYDFGGPTPSSITSGALTFQFYFCPNPVDPPNPNGGPNDKFTMSFIDGSGNIGFQWGYARDNAVYWRTSSSNPWNPTAFIADQNNWDGLRVNLNLSNDTFSIDYFDVSANTWTNIAPVATPMGLAMTNFTTLRWQLEDGLSSGVGGKNFFDDFSVAIPEPASLTACSLIALTLLRRTKRNR